MRRMTRSDLIGSVSFDGPQGHTVALEGKPDPKPWPPIVYGTSNIRLGNTRKFCGDSGYRPGKIMEYGIKIVSFDTKSVSLSFENFIFDKLIWRLISWPIHTFSQDRARRLPQIHLLEYWTRRQFHREWSHVSPWQLLQPWRLSTRETHGIAH